MPRSAIIWTRSRKLSLNVMYHLTHRMMISWSKSRPLNRSCAEVGSVIPAVIAGYRAFQQFAPEPCRQHRRDQRPGCIGQICIIELVDIGANGHHTDDNMSTHTTF